MKQIRILPYLFIVALMGLMPQQTLAQKATSDEEAINGYIMKCNIHMKEPIVLKMADTLQELASRTKDSSALSMVPIFKLEYYRIHGNEDSLRHYVHLAKQVAFHLNRKKYYYQSCQRSIVHALESHQYSQAKKELYELNQEAIRDQSNYGLLVYYKNLYEIFASRNRYRLALSYCDTCLSLIKKDTSLNSEYCIVSFNRIGILISLKRFETALNAIREGRQHPTANTTFRGIYYAFECCVLTEMGDLEGAKLALEQTDHLLPNCYSRTAVSNAHLKYFMATKQYERALKWIEEYEANTLGEDSRIAKKVKSEVLFALGGHDKEAVQLAKEYYTRQDSLSLIEENYDESELLDAFDANLRQINESQKKIKSISTSLLIVGITAIALLIIIVFFIVRWRRRLKDGSIYTSKSLQKTREKIELKAAQSIQQSLLPASPFDKDYANIHAQIIQGTQFGGNYFDFYEYGKHVFFLVGEVYGANTVMAHVLSKIHDIVRCESRHVTTATDIVSYLNDEIFSLYKGKVTATMLMGILDVRTGILSFCNAGHTYPIELIKSGDAKVPYMIKELTPHRNARMGERGDTIFYGGNLPLKPGDKMLVYGQNILDLKDVNGNEFSYESLLTTVLTNTRASPQELVEICNKRISSFLNHETPEVDITFACIEYKGNSNKSE